MTEFSSSASIKEVPSELLAAIFAFNDPIDHGRIRRVCREWRQVPLAGYKDSNFNSLVLPYKMGHVTMQETFDGKALKIGTTTLEWLDSGKLVLHKRLVRGEMCETRFTWHDNGNKKIVEEQNFQTHEVKVTCFYDSGIKAWKSHYKNNMFHGLRKEWYDNGAIKSSVEYSEGLISGAQKKWYRNGQLQQVITRKIDFIDEYSELWGNSIKRRTSIIISREDYRPNGLRVTKNV